MKVINSHAVDCDTIELAASKDSSSVRAAAYLYVGAWLLGLVAAPAAPGLGAARVAVIDFYTSHRVGTIGQSILVHGVAAIALLVVARRWTGRRRGAAVVAVALSLIQLAAGVLRSLASGSAVATLAEGVWRLDGLKMMALAVMVASAAGSSSAAHRLLSRFTAVSLVVSACGYLLLAPAPAAAAVVALPLLLLWVAVAAR